MPRVPTYDPQVREQGLPGAFQRAPDVSSNTRALAQGLSAVADVADRIDLRDAQAKASDAEARIASEWLKWDGAARQQYRGQNVDGYEQAADEWWKNAAETYGKELNPRARELASKSLANKRLQAISSVGNFVNAEKERHADEAYAADVTTTIQFGVTSGKTESTAQQIREKAAQLGARKGWTTEQVQAESLRHVAVLHGAAIERMLDGDKPNPAAAQAYYNKARDANEIPATAQARLEGMLARATDNQFATQFAASVANKPLEDQLAEAAKIEQPERREKTLTQIRNNHAMVKQAERDREDKAADNAWQLFAQGKKIPEAMLADMSGRERVQLQEAQRIRTERLVGGGPKTVKTNPETLAKVYDMMRDDPEGFKKLRMTSLVEVMSPSDIEQVARVQRGMNEPSKEKEVITTVQSIEAYSEGLDKKDKTLFKQRAFDAVDQFQLKNGRPPELAERRKILDELTKEVVLHKGILWDTTGPAFKQEKQPADKFTVGQVYRDAKGNRAEYLGNGKWKPVQ